MSLKLNENTTETNELLSLNQKPSLPGNTKYFCSTVNTQTSIRSKIESYMILDTKLIN